MGESDGSETPGSFTSKLNTISNEAAVLGEKYSEKKLCKKMIRCLSK